MSKFRVEGKLNQRTVKALGRCTKWDSIVSRLTLPTQGDAGDGYHPNLVFMVRAMRDVNKDAKRMGEAFPEEEEYEREMREQVYKQWANVCGVGAAYGDVVLFQQIGAIMQALDVVEKSKPSNRSAVLWLVKVFCRKNNRLPCAREVSEQSGGKISTDSVIKICEAFGVILSKERVH